MRTRRRVRVPSREGIARSCVILLSASVRIIVARREGKNDLTLRLIASLRLRFRGNYNRIIPDLYGAIITAVSFSREIIATFLYRRLRRIIRPVCAHLRIASVTLALIWPHLRHKVSHTCVHAAWKKDERSASGSRALKYGLFLL